MGQEPLRGLWGALRDPSQWIRLGAARVAPWLAPTGAANLLASRAAESNSSLSVYESATVAIALAHAGGDPLSLTAALLKDDVAGLRHALEGDYFRWESYAIERLARASLPGRSYNLLRGFFAAWQRGQYAAESQKRPPSIDPGASRANDALSWLKFWANYATDYDKNTVMKALVEKTFAASVNHLQAGRAAEAATPLVEVALTAPNASMRLIALHALAPLGTNASPLLLAALAGDSSTRPDESVFRSIAEESGEPLPRNMSPTRLAAFLAGEALEEFTDTESAFAIISAAITWRDEPQTRAARVAARMSADVALPPLLWCALYLPSTSERGIAGKLLERIIAKDDALGIRLHHIRSTELNPGQLGWLSEIASERIPERTWMGDPSVCVPVLAQAIAVMPDIVGEAGYVYYTPHTAQRASGFTRSISSLLGLFSGGRGLRATVEARHPQVTFPAFCRLEQNERLSVQLLLAASDSSAPPIDVRFPKGQDHVDLLVLIHAPGFSMTVDQKSILVPRDKPSDVATFDLRAHTAGEQAIDIKFMLGTATVGHCCIVTNATVERRGGEALTILLDPVDTDAMQLYDAAQAVLRVKTCPDGRLAWGILKADTDLQPLGSSPKSFGAQGASDWVKEQGPLIRKMLEEDLSQADMLAVLAQLSARGHALFAQIAPPILAAKLDELQENALVVVDSDADWIPWELLASDPTAKLWGERFVLVRAPVMTKPPNATVAQPGPLPKTIDGALLVIGDKIGQPSRVAKRTFRGMAKRAEPPLIKGDWEQLRARVVGKDIVHFTCHGRKNPYHLSFKEGVGGYFLPEQAHALGLKWGAVVFANACSSGATELLLSDFQSFGREFYYAGARPFIGTLGPVRQEEATEFAGLFYDQFAFAGLPAGQAMRRAREEGAKRFKNPIWLFYCLYGSPSIVRRWTAVGGQRS